MDKWIYFWHHNCAPCKLNKEYVEKLKDRPWFQSVNVLDDTITANEFKIRTVPVLIRQGTGMKTGKIIMEQCNNPTQILNTLKMLCKNV